MGTVLAMKWICVFALVVLTSCGPLGRNNNAIGAVRGITGSNVQSNSPAAVVFSGWALAGLEEQSSDRLLLNVFESGVASTMVQISTNGSRTTWASTEGASITIEEGVISATRGFGADLMGLQTPVVGAALQEPSNYIRTHDLLNGLGQIERLDYQCVSSFMKEETLEVSDKSYETTAYSEVCEGEQYSFTNTYWLTSDGTFVQSVQWISPELGHIGYQKL